MVITIPQDSPTPGLKAGTYFPEVDKLPVKSTALESESAWNEALARAAGGFCKALTNCWALVFSSVKWDNHSNNTLVAVIIKYIKLLVTAWPIGSVTNVAQIINESFSYYCKLKSLKHSPK